MSAKKESLFKQKLKQAKVAKQESQKSKQMIVQEPQSFPKVFKIDKFDVQNSSKQKGSNPLQNMTQKTAMIDQKYEQMTGFEQKPYLQTHKQNLKNIISEDELNQINNQNWNAVNSMNEEERMNYINLIENTLPKHFVDKLRKKGQASKQTKKQNQSLSLMIPQMTNLKISPEQIKSFKPQNNLLKEKKSVQNNENEEMQDQSQNHKAVMDNIHLNIKTNKLVYLPQNVIITLSQDQKDAMVNKAKIYEMLTSDNNQSQVIGSQLTLTWIKNIFPSQNTVFYVQKIPFHTQIMLQELYQLLKVIETNVKATKFYSVYIEMLVKSVQILTVVYRNLTDYQLSEQSPFVESQFQKAQKSLKDLLNSKVQNSTQNSEKNTQQQSKQMLFESLGILYQSLKQQKTQREQISKNSSQEIYIEQKFQKLKDKKKLNDLIEAILIEQTLKKEEFEKYELNPSINYILQTISDYWTCKIKENYENLVERLNQVNQFYTVLYKLVCQFNHKKRALPFYGSLIKKIFEGLLGVLQNSHLKQVLQELFSKKFTDKINSKKNKQLSMLKSQITFKILFIYRQLSGDTQKMASFLQNSQSSWILSQEDANIIVYINFYHYLNSQDLKKEQIQMLEKMLQWLKNQVSFQKDNQKIGFLNAEETLISLLNLFLSNEQQVYSLIDQGLLNDVFAEIVRFYESCQKKNHQKYQILSEVQIKQMIRNYNYNSFGNDIFTKVIFWVAVSISPQTQALIAEEVMMRYPMLFYYASQPLQSPENNPLLGRLSLYMKSKNSLKHFTYQSNQSVKANLLKQLFMSLDFSSLPTIEYEALQNILKTQQQEQTKGFNISKSELNAGNYFYRYLLQPFIKTEKYKQFF